MIVKLTGGLGNQMFEYAFGRALSLDRNLPVQFCWQRATRDYELDKYNVQVELVDRPQNVPVYDESSGRFDPKAFFASDNTFFRGYWQSSLYFDSHASVIQRELTLKKPVRPEVERVAEILREGNTVFLHVRRGDYLNAGTKEVHGILGLDYYNQAISYIREKLSLPRFVVFTDDASWCQQNLPYPIISGDFNFTQHEDLYLMQNCRHGIGANSSFSWWAHYLGRDNSHDRVRIVPKQWFLKTDLDTTDLIPEGWTKI